jgi:uncharacterized protein YdhG (YjbR/CyaY superfamily)
LATTKFTSVEDYIGSFPPEVQAVLEEVRQTIHRAMPGAEESISYQMPAFGLAGTRLVSIGGWKRHLGLYPLPVGDAEFEEAIAPYRSKGMARFPLDEPMPLALIARAVEQLLEQRS